MGYARALLFALLALAGAGAALGAVRLELETPALKSSLGLQRPLIGIARAGNHLVTVGRMGGIYRSEDGGRHWIQASVPVSVDLTSVQFVTAQRGWATGHDGVVLGTRDGGASWQLLLDGRKAAQQMLAYYERLTAEGNTEVAGVLEESRRFAEEDGARPILDVWFEDERRGYIVGAWGLLLRSQDGGASWEPWMHHADNPDSLHFNAIRRVAGRLWIVGERGLMLRLDEATNRFVSMPSPNTGTFFGIVGADQVLLAFGLQGRAFRSADGGESWQALRLPTQGVIAAGDIVPAGTALLGDSTGKLWISRDAGQNFSMIDNGRATPVFGLTLLDGRQAALVGMAGFSLQPLKPSQR